MFMAIDTLEYPELHDESIAAMALVRALNKLMVASGVKDFTLKVFMRVTHAQQHVACRTCTSRMQHASSAASAPSSTLRASVRRSSPPMPRCRTSWRACLQKSSSLNSKNSSSYA